MQPSAMAAVADSVGPELVLEASFRRSRCRSARASTHRKFKWSSEASLGSGLTADVGLEMAPEPLPCADSGDSARLEASDRAWQALIPRSTPSHPRRADGRRSIACGCRQAAQPVL